MVERSRSRAAPPHDSTPSHPPTATHDCAGHGAAHDLEGKTGDGEVAVGLWEGRGAGSPACGLM